MAGLLNLLRTAIRSFELQRQRILLAVSGGPDSTALLRGMLCVSDELQLELCAAHLNHNLRGSASLEDAAWLDTTCTRLGIRLILGSEDVAAFAGSRGLGIEEASRQLRYEFLEQTAISEKCSHVAVAHTADDQVETILHHILRGTGIAGLRGMPASRLLESGCVLVRPLLDCSREDVELFLRELGQDNRDDATNRETEQTRNRIRNSLLPMLRRDYNPQVGEALRRLGRQADDVQQLLNSLAGELLERAVLDANEQICRLDLNILSGQPRHLLRDCFAQLWQRQNWHRQQMGFAEWDCLADLVSAGGPVMLPDGIEACRRGSLLVLRRL
jgi:tRNA(Ile)-lysidine synthase